MSYVIFGASAGLGRALAECSAAAGHDLVLVSSDDRDLARTAANLRMRHGIRVATIAADMGAGDEYLDDVEDAVRSTSTLQGLMFPAGAILPGDDGTLGSRETGWLTRVNFLANANAIARFLPELMRLRAGVIVGFGSVGARRGRGTNVVYSAAKRALESHFASLRHRCSGSGVRVQFYVLGYLDTNRAFGPARLPKGDPYVLSREVVRSAALERGVSFFPRWWRYVVWLIDRVPWPIYRRLRL